MTRLNTDVADDALIRMVGSSRLVRALAWPGHVFFSAWPESLAAAATSWWLSILLAVRVRLVAIGGTVAVVTHIALTGFRAPQPTASARAAWISVLLGLIAIAASARTVAAAWNDWRLRRTSPHQGETA